jgi:hypothetical protein
MEWCLIKQRDVYFHLTTVFNLRVISLMLTSRNGQFRDSMNRWGVRPQRTPQLQPHVWTSGMDVAIPSGSQTARVLVNTTIWLTLFQSILLLLQPILILSSLFTRRSSPFCNLRQPVISSRFKQSYVLLCSQKWPVGWGMG